MISVRKITADQYRTQSGGDFDEAWILVDSGRVRLEVLDSDIVLAKFKTDGATAVVLNTARGALYVKPDREIFVR